MTKKWYVEYLKSSRELNPGVTRNEYGTVYLVVGPSYFTAFDKGVKTHDPFRTKKACQEYVDRINATACETVCVVVNSSF
jgi:hypothetical protein